MRTLMLGWEFPPFISGGLGTACHGLTKAMAGLNVDIIFILPKALNGKDSETAAPWRLTADANGRKRPLSFRIVPEELFSPYNMAGAASTGGVTRRRSVPALTVSAEGPLQLIGAGLPGGYDGDLLGRLGYYAARCVQLALDEDFDVVHAHDWVTFPAGLAVASLSGKPLITHVHSTEFDRAGENVNRSVYDIERQGVHGAAAVIAVSNLTKGILVRRYGVPPEKVEVIHNGIEPRNGPEPAPLNRGGEKTVLFLGRITMQKGPEFFLKAAELIARQSDNVRFVVAGWGDLGPRMVQQAAAGGLNGRMVFTGFLRGKQVEQAYRRADVYVMPSVSEPFGLTALEAVELGVPTVISHSSGVAEVLTAGALKVDFWDVEKMARLITDVLTQPRLAESLRRNGLAEVRRLRWDETARKCVSVYRRCLDAPQNGRTALSETHQGLMLDTAAADYAGAPAP